MDGRDEWIVPFTPALQLLLWRPALNIHALRYLCRLRWDGVGDTDDRLCYGLGSIYGYGYGI
jgi:hypothetical protein